MGPFSFRGETFFVTGRNFFFIRWDLFGQIHVGSSKNISFPYEDLIIRHTSQVFESIVIRSGLAIICLVGELNTSELALNKVRPYHTSPFSKKISQSPNLSTDCYFEVIVAIWTGFVLDQSFTRFNEGITNYGHMLF